ncbi:hypothetical protein ACJX0J_038063, partial [Zea mays]
FWAWIVRVALAEFLSSIWDGLGSTEIWDSQNLFQGVNLIPGSIVALDLYILGLRAMDLGVDFDQIEPIPKGIFWLAVDMGAKIPKIMGQIVIILDNTKKILRDLLSKYELLGK